MGKKIEVEVPIKAMSINQAWQGRRFATKGYKDYTNTFLMLLPKKETINGLVIVHIIFYLKSPLKCDIDNMIKPCLDIIVKKEYIQDDRYICNLMVNKIKSNKDKIRIYIQDYKNSIFK